MLKKLSEWPPAELMLPDDPEETKRGRIEQKRLCLRG